jgi:hypothetical protein
MGLRQPVAIRPRAARRQGAGRDELYDFEQLARGPNSSLGSPARSSDVVKIRPLYRREVGWRRDCDDKPYPRATLTAHVAIPT